MNTIHDYAHQVGLQRLHLRYYPLPVDDYAGADLELWQVNAMFSQSSSYIRYVL